MKTAKISLLGLILICCSMNIFAKPVVKISATYEKVMLGTVIETETHLILNQHLYPLFQVGEQYYVPLKYLKQAGMIIDEKEGLNYLTLTETKEEAYHLGTSFKDQIAYMNPYPIYCGQVRSYSLQVLEEVLIPLSALEGLGQVVLYEGAYEIKPFVSMDERQFIRLDEKEITNLSDYLMNVGYMNIYWNGKAFREEEGEYLLEPGQIKEKNVHALEHEVYVTTLIKQINWRQIEPFNDYGQKDEAFFRHYTCCVRNKVLQGIFPRYTIKATMKYASGELAEKEEVELWRAEKRAYFIVKDKKGKKIQIPYNSLHITGDWGILKQKVEARDIEDFVTFSGIKSKTDYLIWTDVHRQRTYILKKQREDWHLEKSFVCSTGKNINPTPNGLYEVQYTIPYIGIEKGYRCKNALVFFRDYMFHSILFDKSGKYIKSGQYELGQKVSHGCVRLSEADSAWLYKHIPVGTTVWIR